MAENLTVNVKLPDQDNLIKIAYQGNKDGKIDGSEKAQIAKKLAAKIPAEKRTDEYLKKVVITGEPVTVAGTETPIVNLNARYFLSPQAAQKKPADDAAKAEESKADGAKKDEKAAKAAKTGHKGRAAKAKAAASTEKTDETEDVDYDSKKDVKQAKVVIPGHAYTYTKKNAEGEVETDDDDKPIKAKGYIPAKTIPFEVKSNNIKGISPEDAKRAIEYIDAHKSDKFKGIKDESKTKVTLEGETVSLDKLRRIAKDELPGTEKPEDTEAAEKGLVDTMTRNSLLEDAREERRRSEHKKRNIDMALEAIKQMLITGSAPTDILINKAVRLVAMAAQESASDASLSLIQNQQKINDKQNALIEDLENLGKGDKPDYAKMQVLNTKMSRNTQDRQSALSVWRDLNEMLKELRQVAESVDNDTFRTRGNYARFA